MAPGIGPSPSLAGGAAHSSRYRLCLRFALVFRPVPRSRYSSTLPACAMTIDTLLAQFHACSLSRLVAPLPHANALSHTRVRSHAHMRVYAYTTHGTSPRSHAHARTHARTHAHRPADARTHMQSNLQMHPLGIVRAHVFVTLLHSV